MIQQMPPGGFELVPDHTEAQKPHTKGVFFIAGLCFRRTCRPLVERLCGHGKTELDVCLDFPGVQLSVECPELHRAFLEHAVQIQAVVAAVVIMLPAAVPAVVPDAFQPVEGRCV